jgi:hypothetical protein
MLPPATDQTPLIEAAMQQEEMHCGSLSDVA